MTAKYALSFLVADSSESPVDRRGLLAALEVTTIFCFHNFVFIEQAP